LGDREEDDGAGEADTTEGPHDKEEKTPTTTGTRRRGMYGVV
jgi:hypothetical protein